VRADKGNAISKEKPSFVDGAAGGSGATGLRSSDKSREVVALSLRRSDFVAVAIDSFVTVGGTQGRRSPATVVGDLTDRIVGLQNHRCPQAFYGVGSDKTRWC
jgi:hypothetical protein